MSISKSDISYLDYNASAPLPPEAYSELREIFQKSQANPSSLHHKLGRQARKLINEAADQVARTIHCDADFIFWTSGASEANSWAIYSAIEQARFLKANQKVKLLVSAIEHESTLMAAKAAQKNLGLDQLQLGFIPILSSGIIDVQALCAAIEDQKPSLISVMAVNNETGVIQPIEEITKICAKSGISLHIDFVQALGKLPINIESLCAKDQVLYASFSGHKIGAPKGVGFLAVHGRGKILSSLIHGKQQKQLRGGTENPFSIAMLSRVLSLIEQGRAGYPEHLSVFRADFEAEISTKIAGTIIHGQTAKRVANTSYIGFEGLNDDGLLMNLDLEGICASSGSACTSGSIEPSHVLLAMGVEKTLARSSVRFSSGFETTWADYERVLTVLPEIVSRMRTSLKV